MMKKYLIPVITFLFVCAVAHAESVLPDDFDYQTVLIVMVIFGVIAGIARCVFLYSRMKTVKEADEASYYIKEGSLKLRVSTDKYLRTEVTRRYNPREENKK